MQPDTSGLAPMSPRFWATTSASPSWISQPTDWQATALCGSISSRCCYEDVGRRLSTQSATTSLSATPAPLD